MKWKPAQEFLKVHKQRCTPQEWRRLLHGHREARLMRARSQLLAVAAGKKVAEVVLEVLAVDC